MVAQVKTAAYEIPTSAAAFACACRRIHHVNLIGCATVPELCSIVSIRNAYDVRGRWRGQGQSLVVGLILGKILCGDVRACNEIPDLHTALFHRSIERNNGPIENHAGNIENVE